MRNTSPGKARGWPLAALKSQRPRRFVGVLVPFAGPRRPKLAGGQGGARQSWDLAGELPWRGGPWLQVWLCGGRFRDPAPSPARIWILPCNDFHSSPRRSSPCPPREPPRCPDIAPAKEGQCDSEPRYPPASSTPHVHRASGAPLLLELPGVPSALWTVEDLISATPGAPPLGSPFLQH